MKRLATGCLGVAAVFALAACNDPLTVQNENQPDIAGALSTAAGIEQLIQTAYQTAHGITTANGNITPQANALSLESYGSVANFGMGLRVSIPRSGIQNDRGNATSLGTYADFRGFQKLARQTANALQALDTLIGPKKGTLGSLGRNARGRAFAFFNIAHALANTALIYDSAAIIDQTVAPTTVPPLSNYDVVMTRALALFDSAIVVANGIDAAVIAYNTANPTLAPLVVATEVANFAIPSTWINGNGFTRTQFVAFMRSFKARFRAGVARTPTERAAVDWAAVIADATNGITADLLLATDNSAGWTQAHLTQMYTYAGWHLAAATYIGMADTAGAYAAWLSVPLAQRAGPDGTQFLFIRTPDNRFPAGATRAAQVTASGCSTSNTNTACAPSGSATVLGRPYFRNRNSADDTRGDPWAQSQYDHYRFRKLTLSNANRTGQIWPIMTRAEIDLLAAEGYIRTGAPASAYLLIDRSRTAAGLPSVVGATGTFADPVNGTPVPGLNACVPKVPAPPAYNTVACGNLAEALKWEKRMETLFTGYAQWYTDSRGWGDLPEGTALNFPVPYQEMDARSKPFYNLGGLGGPASAAKGTYGF